MPSVLTIGKPGGQARLAGEAQGREHLQFHLGRLFMEHPEEQDLDGEALKSWGENDVQSQWQIALWPRGGVLSPVKLDLGCLTFCHYYLE